ncbi:MAG: YceI family protein [Bacillati bacterium ANGP1]|uniref:YceI family protein n=1 Tax=Candidatus Segetimicrobium genomatis TaxID=2569760 RepID=A0A537J470_9BACT|nr:MAG: YceI family protein [Terrabacteria group bacterium ANGP1]
MRRGVGLIGCLGVGIALVIPQGAEGLVLLPVGTFEIAPGDSSVVFSVPDNRGGFSGRTTRVTGRIVVEALGDGDEYVATVTAMIDAASISTGNAIRDASMRSTFLRTREFPTIAFEGTVRARPGLGVHPFAAAARGRLTIRDLTREVEFPATVTALAREYLADATAIVRMADYQIPYPRTFIFVARDPVTVTLHLRARQS